MSVGGKPVHEQGAQQGIIVGDQNTTYAHGHRRPPDYPAQACPGGRWTNACGRRSFPGN